MRPSPLVSSTPLDSLSATQDNSYKRFYRDKLLEFHRSLRPFKQRPSFQSIVNDELNSAFASPGKTLEANRLFIRCNTAPEPSGAIIQARPYLLPSLLDAVVARVVGQQPGSYASRNATFTRGLTEADDEDLPVSLTAGAFDTFIERLAGSLATTFKAAMDGFWGQPVSATNPSTHVQSLIALRTEQIHAEAILLRADGTLNSGSVLLIEEFIAHPDAAARQSRPYRPAFTLAIKGGTPQVMLALHGALVLASWDPSNTASAEAPQVRAIEPDANAGFVVLFTPTQGLEAFRTLAALDQELHRRLKADHEFDSLLALLADEDQAGAIALRTKNLETGCFAYQELLDPVFSASVQAQCEKLLKDFAFTLTGYQARGVQPDMHQLPASLELATQIDNLFGVQDILQARENKRVKAGIEAFLDKASPEDKKAWATQTQDYLKELADAYAGEGLPSFSQFGDRETLLAYSHEQLVDALDSEYGIDDVDPDSVLVVTQRPNPAPGFYLPGAKPTPQAGWRRHVIQERSLTELALENIGGLDEVFVSDSTLYINRRPYSGLSTQQVKDLIRAVDIGDSYEDFIRSRLLTSPEALIMKANYARVMGKQMRVDALEAKIAGDYLAASGLRGYQWVNSVLNHPVDNAERGVVEGKKIEVRALRLVNTRVRGVLVFCAADRTIPNRVVYTPRAPDGQVFREYKDKQALVNGIFNDPAMHDYVLARMGALNSAWHRRQLAQRVPTVDVYYTVITGNFFEDTYEREVQAAIRDADKHSTSTHETNVRTAWSIIEGVAEVVLSVFPTRITCVIGLVRSVLALSAAVEALQNNDNIGAAEAFVRAFSHLIGAVVDGAVGFSTAPPVRSYLPPNRALKSRPQGISPLAGWEGKGIYVRPGKGSKPTQHFLNEKNRWYKIVFDEASGANAWRLQKPRRSGVRDYHMPPLRRTAAGDWLIASPDVGLKGGYVSTLAHRALRRRYPDLDNAAAARVLDSFDFPVARARTMELDFVRSQQQVPFLAGPLLREIPVEFRQYLNVPLDQARLRLHGIVQTASALPPVLPAPRPSVIANSHWQTWGVQINQALLEPHPVRAGVLQYRMNNGARQRGYFIEAQGKYYWIGDEPVGNASVIYVRDPNSPINSFADLELMLRNTPENQPRPATFDAVTSRWEISSRLPFEHGITAYVGAALPELTPGSQSQLAVALSHSMDGWRSSSWDSLAGTLMEWRTGQVSRIDPLLLLPQIEHATPSGARANFPIARPGTGINARALRRLDFSPNDFYPHFHQAIVHPGPLTLRTLMVEVMTRVMRANLVETSGNRLLFQRAGGNMRYYLHLVDVSTTFILDPGFRRLPRGSGMSRQSTFQVSRYGMQMPNTINLLGGIQRSMNPMQPPSLFVIRISTAPV